MLQGVGIIGSNVNKFKDVFADSEARWSQWLAEMGLERDMHMGKSRRSVRQQTRELEAAARAEPEHWLSTTGLVLFLGIWQDQRRAVSDRQDTQTFFAHLLQKTCGQADLDRLLGEQLPASVFMLCQEGAVGGGACACLAQALQTSKPDASAGTLMATRIQSLTRRRGDCPACASAWSSLIKRVATSMDANREVWGNFDTPSWKVPELPQGRKRRTHDHFQREAASKLRKVSATREHSELEKRGVKRQSLQSRLRCQGVRIINSCFDASRVGTPAVEMLLHVAKAGSAALILPPVVPCLESNTL